MQDELESQGTTPPSAIEGQRFPEASQERPRRQASRPTTSRVSSRLHRKQRAHQEVQPPTYPMEPHRITHHGDTRVDDYYWLGNRKDPRVRQLIERENAALEHFFATSQPPVSPTSPASPSSPTWSGSLRKQLFREMKSRWKEDDVSLPSLDRSYWYYVRQVKNAEYPLFCRRPYNQEAGVNVNFLEEMCHFWRKDPSAVMPRFDDEVIFLDVNLLVQELKLSFADIGEMDISPDENELAFTLDCSGGKEIYTLFVLPIRNVNYAQWLEQDSDAFHRAWAKELEDTQQSVYQPLTPASSLSPSSPASSIGGGCSGSLGLSSKAKLKPSIKKKKGTASGTSPLKHAGVFPAAPLPRHTIRATIDIFDLSNEVLWVSPTSLLYVAIDDKMRKYQVVYHDLTVADPSEASFIVYEEEDEAFWVGSLCFSADEAYVVFCTSSTEVSEWFAVPVSPNAKAQFSLPMVTSSEMGPPSATNVTPSSPDFAVTADSAARIVHWERGACENRVLTEVPIAQKNLMIQLAGREGSLPAERQKAAPVLQFSSRRECAVEYDLDHHKALLSLSEEEGGAWIIVGNPQPCTNFGLFLLPDSVVRARAKRVSHATEDLMDSSTTLPLLQTLAVEETSLPSSTSDLWQLLFAYDADCNVDSVESFYHFLLISVRRKGHLTTLLCPVQRIRDWWAGREEAVSGSPTVAPMNLLKDTIDLSVLLDMFPQLSGSSAVKENDNAGPVTTYAAQLRLSAHGCELLASEGVGEAANEVKDTKINSNAVPACVATLKEVRATPLPFTVECYAESTSYYDPRWRISVTHLLRPSLQLLCEYQPGTPRAIHTGSGDLGALYVHLLKREVVNGLTEYNADEYDGAVVWVPSDHYVSTAEQRQLCTNLPLLVPTKEPASRVDIPVTLCWRKDMFHIGASPMVVHVYGGYGDSDDPEFSTERLSLLDRGLSWAYAAVRGGGELGIPWRDAGRKLQRATTVNDFVSVVSYLQCTGLCMRGHLIGCGGSAGGVAVCRAMMQAPELFFAIVGSAPFVDCLTSLLDDSMPLSVTEREEFGDPVTNHDAYRLIKTLSPVDNVDELVARIGDRVFVETGRQPVLPHVLQVASWEDTRVGYWEPMKLTALLRAKVYSRVQNEVKRLLLDQGETFGSKDISRSDLERCFPHLYFCGDYEAGHAGSSGRYEQLKEIAREYAFILCVLQRQGFSSQCPPAE